MAEVSPQTAGEFVAGLEPGDLQDKAATAVISKWSYADPAGAALRVAEFPESKARDSAMGTVVVGWARKDVESASKFIGELPTGSLRDQAVHSFVTATEHGSGGCSAMGDRNEGRQWLRASN